MRELQSTDGIPGALTTMSGVGPGTTRASLDEAYSTKVRQTTLGSEFTAGELAGLLDGPGRKATITNMWAGLTCIALTRLSRPRDPNGASGVNAGSAGLSPVRSAPCVNEPRLESAYTPSTRTS